MNDDPTWNQGRNPHHDPASTRDALWFLLMLIAPWASIALLVWVGVWVVGVCQ